eukprot:TRINITY_DN6193_c0_g1_i1.p1 TRINITY_DN6193_c0_g1~~TRINITY_DN6193_c0_g1_i1.p1  ORF type:complete len:3324 (+),score=604.92 TRINITY_DN6193_c0_g1_i1:1129-9972(+)
MSSAITRNRRRAVLREKDDVDYMLPKEVFQERAVRICGYLRYYCQLALQQDMLTVVASTCNEYAHLCRFAVSSSSACHDRMFDIFLRIGFEDDPETRGYTKAAQRCVVRAKVALAAYYISMDFDQAQGAIDLKQYARKIYDNVKSFPENDMLSVINDLLLSEQPEVGEADERAAEEIVFLSTTAKMALEMFYSWLPLHQDAQQTTLSGSLFTQGSGPTEVTSHEPQTRPRSRSIEDASVASFYATRSNEHFISQGRKRLKRSWSTGSLEYGLWRAYANDLKTDISRKQGPPQFKKQLPASKTFLQNYSGRPIEKWMIVLVIATLLWIFLILSFAIQASRDDSKVVTFVEEIFTQPDFQVRSSVIRLGETMAVQLIIILTATGILLNMASNRFTPFALRIFYDDPIVKLMGGLCTFCQIFHLFTNFFVTENDYPHAATVVGLTSMAVIILSMIPFFAHMFDYLCPATVINAIQLRERKYRASMMKSPTPRWIQRSQAQTIQMIESLSDLAAYSLDRKDRETTSHIINTLCDIVISHSERKLTTPAEWFSIPQVFQQSLDFITISFDDIQKLALRRNWVEWKIGRQYQSLFDNALIRFKDMCYIISLCTRRIAENATEKQDMAVVDLTFRLFNSYLRLSLDKADVRAFLFNVSQYRALAEYLLRRSSASMVDGLDTYESVQLGDRAVQIARLLRSYSLLSIERKLNSIPEMIAHDLMHLCEVAYNIDHPAHSELLELLLAVDGGQEYRATRQVIPGVRRAHIKHATFYLLNSADYWALVIARDMMDDSQKSLKAYWGDLLTLETNEFWEVSHRMTNSDYMPTNQRSRLTQFFEMVHGGRSFYPENRGTSLESRLQSFLYPPIVAVTEWTSLRTRFHTSALIQQASPTLRSSSTNDSYQNIASHRQYLETRVSMAQQTPDLKLSRTALQADTLESRADGIFLYILQRFISVLGFPLFAFGIFCLVLGFDLAIFGTPVSEAFDAMNTIISRRKLTGLGELSMKLLLTIFTASPVLLQISTIHFSPVVVPLFVRSRFVIVTMGFMVLCNLFFLMCNISIANPYLTNAILLFAIAFIACEVMVMFPYHAYLLDFVRPNQIIRRVTQSGLDAVRYGHPSYHTSLPVKQIQEAQQYFVLAVDRLADIALRALFRHEKNITFLAVDAMTLLASKYAQVKGAMPEQWFTTTSLQQDQDFVAFSEDFRASLYVRRVWVEWKILRQFQMLFADSMKQLPDLCYLIGVNTRSLAEVAAQCGDVHTIQLCIRFFNTYIRLALNGQDIRALNVIMLQYSRLASMLLIQQQTANQYQNLAHKVDLEKAVLLIASFFKYYATLAMQEQFYDFVEIASHDMVSLLEAAMANQSKCHSKLFMIFSSIGVSHSTRDVPDGVLRARMKLAALYYSKKESEYVKQMSHLICQSSAERIVGIWNELASHKTPEIWELNDRWTNINYLVPAMKQSLSRFLQTIPECKDHVMYDRLADEEILRTKSLYPDIRPFDQEQGHESTTSFFGETKDTYSPSGLAFSTSRQGGFNTPAGLRKGLHRMRHMSQALLTEVGLSASAPTVKANFFRRSVLENRQLGYLFTSDFRVRFLFVGVLIMILAFLVYCTKDAIDQIKSSSTELGGLGEIMAVILTVVLTVTAIFVNIAASRFTPAVTSLFLYNKSIHLMLSFFVIGTFYITLVDLTVGADKSSSRTLFVSILIATFSVLMLIPYFALLFSMLDPSRVITMFLENGLGFTRIRREEDIWKAQQECNTAIEQLSNLGLKVMQFNERNMTFMVVDALSSFCTQYGAHKTVLQEDWFRLRMALRSNADFITLSDETSQRVTQMHTWVEWKILRHFQLLFSSGMGPFTDVCNVIALHTCNIARDSIRRGDLAVLDLCITFMNTFIRMALTRKEPDAAQSVLYHYRRLACFIIKKSKSRSAVSEAFYARKVIQISEFFSFYGSLFDNASVGFIVQAIGYELATLCEVARESDFKDEDVLVKITMEYVNRTHVSNPTVLRSIIKLGTWYLQYGWKVQAARLVDELDRGEYFDILQSLCQDLLRAHLSSRGSQQWQASEAKKVSQSMDFLEINDPGFSRFKSKQIEMIERFMFEFQHRGHQLTEELVNMISTNKRSKASLNLSNGEQGASSHFHGLDQLGTSPHEVFSGDHLYMSSSTTKHGNTQHAYATQLAGISTKRALSIALPIITGLMVIPAFFEVRSGELQRFGNDNYFDDPVQLASSLSRLSEQHAEKTRFMFMVTLTAAQTACLRYSGLASLHVVINPSIFCALLWGISAVVIHVWISYVILEYEIAEWMIYISVMCLSFTLLLMFPYFLYMLEQMVPINIIKKSSKICRQALDILPERMGDQDTILNRQLRLVNIAECLTEYGLRTLQMNDKAIFTLIIESFSDMALTYGESKTSLPDIWFRLDEYHHKGVDFVSISKSALEDLIRCRTWFEWKIFRQLLVLYTENTRNMRDHPHLISLTTFKIAVSAADRRDFDVLELSFKFFNSFIRIAINAGDYRTASIVMDKYRQLGEYITHLSSPSTSVYVLREKMTKVERLALRQRLESCTVQLSRNLLYYAQLFREKSAPQLHELAASDLECLVRRAHECRCTFHNTVLEYFFSLARTQTGGHMLRGVIRAHIKLATHYLSMSDVHTAWMVYLNIRHVQFDRVASIIQEMKTLHTSLVWEIFNYRTRGDNITVVQSAHLITFLNWFRTHSRHQGVDLELETRLVMRNYYAHLPVETIRLRPASAPPTQSTLSSDLLDFSEDGIAEEDEFDGDKLGAVDSEFGGNKEKDGSVDADDSAARRSVGKQRSRHMSLALSEISNPAMSYSTQLTPRSSASLPRERPTSPTQMSRSMGTVAPVPPTARRFDTFAAFGKSKRSRSQQSRQMAEKRLSRTLSWSSRGSLGMSVDEMPLLSLAESIDGPRSDDSYGAIGSPGKSTSINSRQRSGSNSAGLLYKKLME